MKINLSGIILFVKDVEELKAFYINNFNPELIEEISSEWVLLKAGQCEIGLHKIGSQYFTDIDESAEVESNTKMVFDIDEDIYLLREQLLKKNVILGEVKTWDGFDYLVCDGKDPEGNVFQLKQIK
ncbi:MAG TPA: VOC family protein [Ignavibacteria bacterium]|nr:VOC family protein [Ignavibacteria bacterium]